jgi:hypothetical protein
MLETTEFIGATQDKEEENTSDFWMEQLKTARRYENDWRAKALDCWRLYKGSSPENEYAFLSQDQKHIYGALREKDAPITNIFYSNAQTLKSCIMPMMPRPVIRQKDSESFGDDNDRQKALKDLAIELLEKTAEYFISKTSPDEFEKFKCDYFVTGRGVLWMTADVGGWGDGDELGKRDSRHNVGRGRNGKRDGDAFDKSFEYDNEDSGRGYNCGELYKKSYGDELITLERVSFEDFLMQPADRWQDVRWVARKRVLSKEDFKKKFPKYANSHNAFESIRYADECIAQEAAVLWEIWDKKEERVLFACASLGKILKTVKNPYQLKGFLPTAQPLQSVSNNLKMTPIPEFCLYESLAKDLDKAQKRISRLISSMKAHGFYNQKYANVAKALMASKEGEYVPVESDAPDFFNNLIVFAPLEEKQRVIEGLYRYKQNLMQSIYEITGISEIMRNIGVDETATSVNTRSRFGSLRLQQRQNQANAYMKQTYEIVCEFAGAFLDADTISKITSAKLPFKEEIELGLLEIAASERNLSYADMEEAQRQEAEQSLREQRQDLESKITWEELLEYLRNADLSKYLIEAETDFDVLEDDAKKQEKRMNLLNAFSSSLSNAMPLMEAAPGTADAILELISFAMDSFEAPLTKKEKIQGALKSLKEEIKTALQAKLDKSREYPEPESVKAQAELLNAQAKMEEVKTQGQIHDRKTALEEAQVQLKFKEIDAKTAADAAMAQLKEEEMQVRMKEAQTKELEAYYNFELKKADLAIKTDAEHKKETNNLNLKALEMERDQMRESNRIIADAAIENDKLAMKKEELEFKKDLETSKQNERRSGVLGFYKKLFKK